MDSYNVAAVEAAGAGAHDAVESAHSATAHATPSPGIVTASPARIVPITFSPTFSDADEKICTELHKILGDLDLYTCGRSLSEPSTCFLRLIDLSQTFSADLFFAVTSSHDMCAIHAAAFFRKPDYFALLHARGADLTATDSEDWTVARFLIEGSEVSGASQGLARIMELLVKLGADLDARDIYNCSPLDMACRNGDAEAVKALLGAPGERGGWERSGEVFVQGGGLADSPLFHAVHGGALEAVKLLCSDEYRPRAMLEDVACSSIVDFAESLNVNPLGRRDDIVRFLKGQQFVRRSVGG